MLFLLGCKIRECGQRIAPHGIDQVAEFGQTLRIQSKIMTGTAAFFFNQSGGFEKLQVLRYGGAADGKVIGQFADSGGAAAEQIENSLAGGIGEGCKPVCSVSHTLR
jgi:hypothetical protein